MIKEDINLHIWSCLLGFVRMRHCQKYLLRLVALCSCLLSATLLNHRKVSDNCDLHIVFLQQNRQIDPGNIGIQ
jgi:hypothetical protein